MEDTLNVIYYLVTQWSYDTADKFEALTLSRLETLTGKPFIGITSSANNEVRSIVLTKHNKLYYRVKGQVVIVLNIFDTRQDPSKNKFESGPLS